MIQTITTCTLRDKAAASRNQLVATGKNHNFFQNEYVLHENFTTNNKLSITFLIINAIDCLLLIELLLQHVKKNFFLPVATCWLRLVAALFLRIQVKWVWIITTKQSTDWSIQFCAKFDWLNCFDANFKRNIF